MDQTKNCKTGNYILTERHMERLDELVSELQSLFLDVFSNWSIEVRQDREKGRSESKGSPDHLGSSN